MWTRAQFRAWLRPALKSPRYLRRWEWRAFLPFALLMGVYMVCGLLVAGGSHLLGTLAENADSPQRSAHFVSLATRSMDAVAPWVPIAVRVFVTALVASILWLFWQVFRLRAETRRFHAAGGRICGWCGYDTGRGPESGRSVCAECGKETAV